MPKQTDRYKWRDGFPPPKVSREQMEAAMAYAEDPENLKCECWNTGCKVYGDCAKCLAFHLAIKQFPTCQRELMEEVYGYYNNGDSLRGFDS